MTDNKKPKRNLVGRPPALTFDEKTLKTIRGLGKIQATTRECAAVLGVSHPTFLKFKDENPRVLELLEEGREHGKSSLRRRQYKAAMDGQPTMLVWLGKQYLDQKDKQEIASTHEVVVTDARSRLEHILLQRSASSADTEGTTTTH